MRTRIVFSLAAAAAVAMLACTSEMPDPSSSPREALEKRSDANEGSARSGFAGPTPSRPAPATVTATSSLSDMAAQAPAMDSISIAPQVAPAPGVPASNAAPQSLPGSMLIRTGFATLQVDSLQRAIARVHEIAGRVGGVVANTVMQTGKDEVPSATLELRIPSARFDEAVAGLRPLGKVENINVQVADVGEEFVDVTARVTNARRLEQRLIELLANRTGRLSDVLSVERELARVREQIERYEGRIRYLQQRVSVSTLTVSVHEPPPLVAVRPGATPIRDALKQAWRNFVGVIAASIASLGVVIPLGLIVVAGIFVWRRFGPELKPAAGAATTQGQ